MGTMLVIKKVIIIMSNGRSTYHTVPHPLDLRFLYFSMKVYKEILVLLDDIMNEIATSQNVMSDTTVAKETQNFIYEDKMNIVRYYFVFND